MFNWFKRLCGLVEEVDPIEEDYSESRRDNLPKETVSPLPEYEEVEYKVLLWYPKRVVDPKIKDYKMKTRGYYKDGHPEGAIVHFTAGRSRTNVDGGRRNSLTHKEQGIRGVQYATKKGSYSYFLIDRDGNVFQQFPLNRWGYHAGKSTSPADQSTSISNEYVGIELQNAGKLTKVDDDKFLAWFSKPEKGDEYFHKYKNEVRFFEAKENIEAGYYHQCSLKQEAALVDLVLWLDQNGNGTFCLDKVFGHDEVSPGRKCDPGGSIGKTMNDFRKMVQNIKKLERGK